MIGSVTRIIMNTKEEDCIKFIMQDADADKRPHNFKRRRAREQGNITCFVTFVKEVGKFTNATTFEDYEYYKDRLHETLG